MLPRNVATVILLHGDGYSVQALLLHAVEHTDHARSEEDLGKTDLILFLIRNTLLEDGRANWSKVVRSLKLLPIAWRNEDFVSENLDSQWTTPEKT